MPATGEPRHDSTALLLLTDRVPAAALVAVVVPAESLCCPPGSHHAGCYLLHLTAQKPQFFVLLVQQSQAPSVVLLAGEVAGLAWEA